MTLRLVHSVPSLPPGGDVWEPLLSSQITQRVSPILNIKEDKIHKAFAKLRDNQEMKSLTSLLSGDGVDFLRVLPELAEFPEPESVLEVFLEDYLADEDPLLYDEDLVEDEEDVHDVLQATEKTRLLRMVLYFWHLAHVSGEEAAKDTLVDLLHALALFQLLKTNGLTELQVRFHSHTLTLPLSFRSILQNTKLAGTKGTLRGLQELIQEKVLLATEDEDPLFIARAVREAKRNFNRILSQDRAEFVTLRGFSHVLLEDGMAESLADIILDACPPRSKKKL